MRRGKYRHKITIQNANKAANDDGQLVASWTTHATEWGEIAHTAGSETFNGIQLEADETAVVKFPSCTATRTLSAEMRLVWDGRFFYVRRFFDWQERNREVWVTVEESKT